MQLEKGVTLIEVILVLAIAMVILILSIQQYVIYKRDADVATVRYNVDLLFEALANYFRANCGSNPFNTLYNSQYYPISMTELKPFLSDNLAYTPIIDASSQDGGYIVQFNQLQTNTGLPQRMINMSAGGQASVGNIALWQAQVSVKLVGNTTVYRDELAGDCLSSTGATSASGSSPVYVTPCVAGGDSKGDYVVFARLPSLAVSKENSPNWVMLPTVKQFQQLYTVDPVLYLTSGAQEASQQYYFCGS